MRQSRHCLTPLLPWLKHLNEAANHRFAVSPRPTPTVPATPPVPLSQLSARGRV